MKWKFVFVGLLIYSSYSLNNANAMFGKLSSFIPANSWFGGLQGDKKNPYKDLIWVDLGGKRALLSKHSPIWKLVSVTSNSEIDGMMPTRPMKLSVAKPIYYNRDYDFENLIKNGNQVFASKTAEEIQALSKVLGVELEEEQGNHPGQTILHFKSVSKNSILHDLHLIEESSQYPIIRDNLLRGLFCFLRGGAKYSDCLVLGGACSGRTEIYSLSPGNVKDAKKLCSFLTTLGITHKITSDGKSCSVRPGFMRSRIPEELIGVETNSSLTTVQGNYGKTYKQIGNHELGPVFRDSYETLWFGLAQEEKPSLNYDDAKKLCKSYGLRLATPEEWKRLRSDFGQGSKLGFQKRSEFSQVSAWRQIDGSYKYAAVCVQNPTVKAGFPLTGFKVKPNSKVDFWFDSYFLWFF